MGRGLAALAIPAALALLAVVAITSGGTGIGMHSVVEAGPAPAPNTSTHSRPELYVFRVEPLRADTGWASSVLEVLSGRKAEGIVFSGNGFAYRFTGSGELVDFYVDRLGVLRFYRVHYRYNGYTSSCNCSAAVERAERLVGRLLALYRAAGLNANAWSLRAESAVPDIVLLANGSSVSRMYSFVSVIFEARLGGVRVDGLYRVELYPDGRVKAVYLDLWNARPIASIPGDRLLPVNEALKRHVDARLLGELAGGETARVTGAELVYTPARLSNGTVYLVPAYKVYVKGYSGAIVVPAVDTPLVSRILRGYLNSLREEAATTTSSAPAGAEHLEPCWSLASVERVEIVASGKASLVSRGEARRVLDRLHHVLEAATAVVARCALDDSGAAASAARRGTSLHIVYREPVDVPLHNVWGRVEHARAVELYLAPWGSENPRGMVLYLKSPGGLWSCYHLLPGSNP